jgi:D-amino peptidase
VKKGLGRFAARNLAHADACALIEQKVYESLTSKNWPKPLKMDPAELRIELHSPDQADSYIGRPGVELIDPRTIVTRADTFWELWDRFWPR